MFDDVPNTLHNHGKGRFVDMTSYIFECVDCKKHFTPSDTDYLCPDCSIKQKEMEPLSGVLRCIYDYKVIAKKFTPSKLTKKHIFGFERWEGLLPLESMDHLPPLITQFTPLRSPQHLQHALGVAELYLKDDTSLPTASFKDRASALAVACAKERNFKIIATASTGNAATALAGQSAAAEMDAVIFVPKNAPAAKLAQIAIFGAKLIPINGTYDEAFELSIKACKEFGWYNRNTAYNPFTIEGKKTAALEIWEQMDRTAPDWVIVPTGDGVILAGLEKGFADLLAMGLIDNMPRLAAVQAEGCQPIVSAIEGNCEIKVELKPKTIADSISVGVPRAGHWALDAIRSTNGTAIAASDEEIIDAISFLGKTTGVFAEPAAATAIAGLKKLIARGTIQSGDRVVTLITGSGLKDVPAAAKCFEMPKAIEPSIEAVRKIL